MNSDLFLCFVTITLLTNTLGSSSEGLQVRYIFTGERPAAQRFQQQSSSTALRRIKRLLTTGASVRFCYIFNCGCIPPVGQICCNNFTYDFRRRRCRELV
ncbi:hypothetical protein NPIL_681461 [Nephila pilipes]|uniref:Spider venom protein n=1 Tax=Nephila pilipes TaxID=299642 RepID=A0A8X6UIK2_NEPPI|nr:hypothetical protein NPIL_681461 [Nephila pilipes]